MGNEPGSHGFIPLLYMHWLVVGKASSPSEVILD
jgi:hypothetical protein